jgi:hypothetical protein
VKSTLKFSPVTKDSALIRGVAINFHARHVSLRSGGTGCSSSAQGGKYPHCPLNAMPQDRPEPGGQEAASRSFCKFNCGCAAGCLSVVVLFVLSMHDQQVTVICLLKKRLTGVG